MDTNRTVISALANNHSGVLLRVVGLFARRGFNISSLTACETEIPGISRMTIQAQGDERTMKQIARQLYKLEDIKKVLILEPGMACSCELLLVKVSCHKSSRSRLLEILQSFGSCVLDIADDCLTLESTGHPDKIDSLIEELRPFGILEMARTGLTALERGSRTIQLEDFS